MDSDERYYIHPDGVVEWVDDEYGALGFLCDTWAERFPSNAKRSFLSFRPLLHVVVLFFYFGNSRVELEAFFKNSPN